MAHGTPDWAEERSKSTVYGGIDLAEHANRLGAPFTFDGRGDVLWLDTFKSGVTKWVMTSTGTGSSDGWSAESSEYDGFSAKLVVGTEGWGRGAMLRSFPLPVLSKLGKEFAVNLDADITQLTFDIIVYDGVRITSYPIRYTAATGLFEYQTVGGGFLELSPLKILHTYRHLFHVLKLVIDPTKKEFVRLIVDDTAYNMAGLAAYLGALETLKYARVDIGVVGTVAENAVAFIDRATLTHNEP